MKLTIERNALLNVLKHVTGVVEKRNTIPVLSNILIDAHPENVSFVATDMEIQIIENIAANVEQTGAFTVPSQTLFDIVRKLSNDEVTIETIENSQVLVSSGRSRFKLSTLPVSDFPVMPKDDHKNKFGVDASELRVLIDHTRFAMSMDDTRYYLNGIYIHSFEDALRAVATDGHRLAVSEFSVPDGANGMKGVIIPRKTVGEVRKILDEISGVVEMALSESKVRFTFENIVITSKLIDGTFPDYERVIPANSEKLLNVSVGELIRAVDRVAVVSIEKTKAIKFDIMPDELALSSAASGIDARDVIDAELSGEPMTIGFNAKYLLDVLSVISGNEIGIELSGTDTPVVIRDGNALYVLMPMRV